MRRRGTVSCTYLPPFSLPCEKPYPYANKTLTAGVVACWLPLAEVTVMMA